MIDLQSIGFNHSPTCPLFFGWGTWTRTTTLWFKARWSAINLSLKNKCWMRQLGLLILGIRWRRNITARHIQQGSFVSYPGHVDNGIVVANWMLLLNASSHIWSLPTYVFINDQILKSCFLSAVVTIAHRKSRLHPTSRPKRIVVLPTPVRLDWNHPTDITPFLIIWVD